MSAALVLKTCHREPPVSLTVDGKTYQRGWTLRDVDGSVISARYTAEDGEILEVEVR